MPAHRENGRPTPAGRFGPRLAALVLPVVLSAGAVLLAAGPAAYAADDDQLDRIRKFAVGAAAAQSIGGGSASLSSDVENDERGQEAAGVASEAAAQRAIEKAEARAIPFGANLFQGQFAANRPGGLNPDYLIAPGDRVSVNLYGAQTFSQIVSVDGQGNLFVPEVGPVHVAGVPNRALQSTVEARVRRVFTENVRVYVNLLGSQTLGVFVTGSVVSPGRYAGLPTDPLLTFIDQAGGVDLERGSFRNIAVLRDGKEIARADLYDFLMNGGLPRLRFREGDVILVGPIGGAVAVTGDVRAAAAYEFPRFPVTGQALAAFARPNRDVSHVALSGFRDGRPFNAYLTFREFLGRTLEDGDLVDFQADLRSEDVFVEVEGEHLGAGRLAVARGAKLDSVLDMIAIDPAVAATDAIYLRRESVARDQKRALDQSLDALERTALAALSQTRSQADIRAAEARLVLEFIKRARTVQPDGRVVVSTDEGRADVRMEPGDKIVIPQKTDLVLITGEVTLPQTVAHMPGADISDYVARAGGFADRADRDRIIIIRAGGAAIVGDDTQVRPGDQIMVVPVVDLKTFEIGKDVVEVLFRVAIIAATVIAL